MTSPAAGEPSRPRTGSRLAKAALILSLTLNVFLIGGFVYAKVAVERWMTPGERFQALAKELTLTPDQRAAFQKLIETMRLGRQHLRDTNQPLIEQAWNELAKPQADQQALTRIIAQVADNRRQFQTEVAAAMGEFLATLTPDQRAQFVRLAKERRDTIARRIWSGLQP